MTIKQAVSGAIGGLLLLTPVVALATHSPTTDPTHGSASYFDADGHIEELSAEPGFQGQIPGFQGVPGDGDNVDLVGVIQTVVNAFLALVGLIAVIVIIFAGFRYITSGGDEEATGAAKNQIIFALIGLVIIVLSAVIVNFILGIFPSVG
jgi:hypothetical protein